MKFGKTDKTVDPVFNQEKDAFTEKHKQMQNLNKVLEKYERNIRGTASVPKL